MKQKRALFLGCAMALQPWAKTWSAKRAFIITNNPVRAGEHNLLDYFYFVLMIRKAQKNNDLCYPGLNSTGVPVLGCQAHRNHPSECGMCTAVRT